MCVCASMDGNKSLNYVMSSDRVSSEDLEETTGFIWIAFEMSKIIFLKCEHFSFQKYVLSVEGHTSVRFY